MKKPIDIRVTGKLISDLPASNSAQDSDVFEGQNLNSGSYKITFQDLSREVSKKFNVPVATSQSVGGIKSSSNDKSVNVIADGTAIVNNVPSVTEMNAALSNKVDVVPGRQLSQEDFTTALRIKLEGIQDLAEKNIINSISVNGSNVPPVNGNIDLNFQATGNIPPATLTTIGGFKASDDNGCVSIDAKTSKAGVNGWDYVEENVTKIGNLNNLNTSVNTTLVDAINEVSLETVDIKNSIGNLKDLVTTEKSNLVSALNEVSQSDTSITTTEIDTLF